MAVLFSPDGKRLFSGGSEGSITIWDLQHRTKVLTLDAPGGSVSALALSSDGRRLASCGSQTGEVQIWDTEVLDRETRWGRHEARGPLWQTRGAR
jgi:WD40 repeat protein